MDDKRCAFHRCEGLTGNLDLPDSITFIGDYVFAECGFDGTLHLSKGLTEIPQAAFSNCKNLKGDLVIPEGIRSIDMHAFVDDGFDGTLTLPDTLEYIGIYSLSCRSLTGDLVIPDSVTLIDSSAFQSCSGFTSLKLPEGIQYIREGAFLYCQGMTGELNLPSSLIVIGNNAFGMTGFTGELVLPDGLESIGSGSFAGCEGFTSIKGFPGTLKHIKESAFSGCSSLKGELTFPDRMTYIGDDAFRNCPLLKKATFGKDLCSIGEGAFEKCDALASVTFTGEISDYYGREEEHPSFPEACSINSPGETTKLSEIWKENASRPVPGKQKEDDYQSSWEVPYYWTQSLIGEDYRGAGYYADIVLNFDEDTIHVKINGRELMAAPYYADKNAGSNEEQKVSTDGFFCREGWVSDLDYETGFGNDNRLSGVLTREDGTTEEVIFHTGSEECLYIQK